jgi:hypothetical protein
MIERFLHEVALKAKAKTGASPEVGLLFWASAVFAVLAFIFLSFAAYAWLATIYSSAAAALIVGIGQLVVSGCAIGIALAIRRSNRRHALAQLELEAAKQKAAGWHLDPAYLAVAIEIVRTIGVRNIIPLVVGGVAAAGWGVKKATDGKR